MSGIDYTDYIPVDIIVGKQSGGIISKKDVTLLLATYLGDKFNELLNESLEKARKDGKLEETDEVIKLKDI